MALIIPETLPVSNNYITPGERKTFEYLKEKLPDDYIVYYNIPISGYYPDFIIINPDFGIFVLEVKDWKINNIKAINKEEVTVDFGDQIKKIKNPVQQAREYILKIIDLIKSHNYFKKYDISLKWGCGVLFTNITDRDFEKMSLFTNNLNEVLGSDFIFSANDLKDDRLIKKIKLEMNKHYGKIFLDKDKINIIRSIIYPELTIGNIDEDIVKVIEVKQEQIAKNLGLGHYLIRGVAGSGKTIILIARAKYISMLYPNWKILLLCYNKTLSNNFKRLLKNYKNIEINTFHGWCLKKLSSCGIKLDNATSYDDIYWEKILPSKLIEASNNGLIKEKKYDAILIDEGQDFSNLWYKTILQFLNDSTNSLLIALDNSQSIYNRKVSWKELGINIVGRTKVLKTNYRNTKQILEYSYSIIKDLDEKNNKVSDNDSEYLAPEKVLREGPPVEVKEFDNINKEKEFLLSWLKDRMKNENSSDIFILCLIHKDAEDLFNYLKSNNINVSFMNNFLDNTNIYVLTVHSSKGLESDNVLVYNAQNADLFNKQESKRLLYIAMTRAKKNLCVCYLGKKSY
ncbi:MAG: NERD domain-containing protein [Elusimicrobiota bacterium]